MGVAPNSLHLGVIISLYSSFSSLAADEQQHHQYDNPIFYHPQMGQSHDMILPGSSCHRVRYDNVVNVVRGCVAWWLLLAGKRGSEGVGEGGSTGGKWEGDGGGGTGQVRGPRADVIWRSPLANS